MSILDLKFIRFEFTDQMPSEGQFSCAKTVGEYVISLAENELYGHNIHGEMRVGFKKAVKEENNHQTKSSNKKNSKVYMFRINHLPLTKQMQKFIETQYKYSQLNGMYARKVYSNVQSSSNNYLVLEYFPKTFQSELTLFRQNQRYFDEMIEKFLKCYSFYYNMSIFHGNLIAKNIGISFDGQVKLMDFAYPKDHFDHHHYGSSNLTQSSQFLQESDKDFKFFKQFVSRVLERDSKYPKKFESFNESKKCNWQHLFVSWHITSPLEPIYMSRKNYIENLITALYKLEARIKERMESQYSIIDEGEDQDEENSVFEEHSRSEWSQSAKSSSKISYRGTKRPSVLSKDSRSSSKGSQEKDFTKKLSSGVSNILKDSRNSSSAKVLSSVSNLDQISCEKSQLSNIAQNQPFSTRKLYCPNDVQLLQSLLLAIRKLQLNYLTHHTTQKTLQLCPQLARQKEALEEILYPKGPPLKEEIQNQNDYLNSILMSCIHDHEFCGVTPAERLILISCLIRHLNHEYVYELVEEINVDSGSGIGGLSFIPKKIKNNNLSSFEDEEETKEQKLQRETNWRNLLLGDNLLEKEKTEIFHNLLKLY